MKSSPIIGYIVYSFIIPSTNLFISLFYRNFIIIFVVFFDIWFFVVWFYLLTFIIGIYIIIGLFLGFNLFIEFNLTYTLSSSPNLGWVVLRWRYYYSFCLVLCQFSDEVVLEFFYYSFYKIFFCVSMFLIFSFGFLIVGVVSSVRRFVF
uniref:Uncharacterized protein n=1 Tax=Cacopsylla melanoneura TaxID=428564 RepID=A0A8D8ZJD9_9HEMI